MSSGAVDKERAIELGLVEEDDAYVLYGRELMQQGIRTPLPVQEINHAEWEFATQGYTVSYWFVMVWDNDMNPLGYKMLCIEA